MSRNLYDHHIAGAKTLWILQFSPSEKERSTQEAVEFLVPTPFDPKGWVVIKNPLNIRSIEALLRFEKVCDETTERCRRQLEAQGVSSGLDGDFPDLIRYFQEFLKHFQKPPPSENERPFESPDL